MRMEGKREYRFKLNPCPRCMNDDNLATYEYENGWVHVECTACNYLGPGCGSRRQAAKAHNAQATITPAGRLALENQCHRTK